MKELTSPTINLLGNEGQQVEGDIHRELGTTGHTGGDGERKTPRKQRQMNGNKLGETPAKPDTTSTQEKKRRQTGKKIKWGAGHHQPDGDSNEGSRIPPASEDKHPETPATLGNKRREISKEPDATCQNGKQVKWKTSKTDSRKAGHHRPD